MITIEAQSGSKHIEKVFYDTIGTVGTNPSAMFVIKKIQSGSLPTHVLTKMVSHTLRSLRFPTKAMVTELVKCVKSPIVQADEQLLTTFLLHLSNLFYKAYVHPTTMITSYPTKLYGIFGTSESTVLTDDFIPFLVGKLENPESEHIRLVAITSLGKLGHFKAIKPLLTVTKEPRSVAIFSLKRIAKLFPTEVRPILMTIITNPAESTNVKIAAVAIIPFTNPTIAQIQSLCIHTWYVESKQVSSFIYSTMHSLASTVDPELKMVGEKAKIALPLLKPENFGIQYSQNLILSRFIEHLKTTFTQKIMVVNNKESIIPHIVSMETLHYSPSLTKAHGPSFTAYNMGMDILFEKYLEHFTTTTQASSAIKTQLDVISNELKLKARTMKTPFFFTDFSFMDMESTLHLDSNIVLDTIDQLMKFVKNFENDYTMGFSHVSTISVSEYSSFVMSEAGFPIVASFHSPIVFAVTGSIKAEYPSVTPKPVSNARIYPSITAKITPVIKGKMQSVQGIVSPFTNELIATGVDVSLHSFMPLEVEGSITGGQAELKIRTPIELEQSGLEAETIHMFIKPYTVKKNILTVSPICESPSVRTITSGIPRQPIDIPIGQSLGLSGRLQLESDAQFSDLYSYLNTLRQHSPLSNLHMAIIPSSVRASSARILYNPTKSETKEITFAVRLTTTGIKPKFSAGPISAHQLHSFAYVKNVLSRLGSPSSIASVVEITASRTGPSVHGLSRCQRCLASNQNSLAGLVDR